MVYNYNMSKVIFRRSGMKRGATVLVILVLITAFVTQLFPANQTSATTDAEFSAKIKELEKQVNDFRAKATEFASQAETLSNAVAQLQAQQDTIQAEIDLNNAKLDKLNAEITDNETKMKKQSEALAKSIAAAYIAGEPSSLEVLANSSTLSDYVNNRSQQEALQAQLNSLTDQINKIKKELQIQRSDVESILAEQTLRRDQIATSKKKQQDLLAQTQGQEAKYQAMIGDRQKEIDDLRAQWAILQAAMSNSKNLQIVGTIPDGYPWNESNCPMSGMFSTGGANGNGGDGRGYGCRQCTSYAAWRMAKETGLYPSWGNANQFPAYATSAGYTVSSVARGRSLGVIMSGTYGHVVYVESVDPGGTLTVSQYNYNWGAGWGLFSKVTNVLSSTYQYYIYL